MGQKNKVKIKFVSIATHYLVMNLCSHDFIMIVDLCTLCGLTYAIPGF